MTCKVITLPILTTQDTAGKFKNNYLAQPQQCTVMAPSIKQEPVCDENLDDSLTSLNWLHNLKIMKIGQPTPPSSPTPLSVANQHPENLPTYIQKQQLKLMSACDRTDSSDIKPLINRTNSVPDHVDYKQNGNVKPPYSYATLIWMAMKESKKNKITLSAIYKWITDNFKYYRTADPSWQVSFFLKLPFFFNIYSIKVVIYKVFQQSLVMLSAFLQFHCFANLAAKPINTSWPNGIAADLSESFKDESVDDVFNCY